MYKVMDHKELHINKNHYMNFLINEQQAMIIVLQ